ncbi:hypothetical protein B0J18DRAFT_444171 [Chaetomium sp. MPI-SDFR-AT-0129]|nr:hypothetical protein B0J18DRAFT_444171 [Chaetomium sp. MPI-SDFR-AT-0129]
METTPQTKSVSIQDSQSCIPLTDYLEESDLIVLLTPAIIPGASPLNSNSDVPPSDPFEPFGQALAKHHSRVRHVPYTPRGGITSTHKAHIDLAAIVIFVISGPSYQGQPSQITLAEDARALCKSQPMIIVACCSLHELDFPEAYFPTTLEIPSFNPLDLELAANALFEPTRSNLGAPNAPASPLWSVQRWNKDREPSEVLDLWNQCLPKKFNLNLFKFQSLLRRDGYAMHFVVREPETAKILGFCAAYTAYADSDGERLLGSLAVLLVQPSYRRQGIGRTLHDHALRELKSVRGICRLQLGSTFPRLLYGLPPELECEDWFRRRKWRIESASPALEPGLGQEACDWILSFENWPATDLTLPHLSFRPCEPPELYLVLEFVDRESKKNDNLAWYDQYAKLTGTMNIMDIVLGLNDGAIVAVALTYVKNTGSPAEDDLPWASTIAEDIGGVTCVCLSDEATSTKAQRDAVVTGLFDACIQLLAKSGKNKLFVDAVKWDEDELQSLGFRKWASYREVWRNV